MTWNGPSVADLSQTARPAGACLRGPQLVATPWSDPNAATAWLAGLAVMISEASSCRDRTKLLELQHALREAYAQVLRPEGPAAGADELVRGRWQGQLLAYGEIVRWALEEAVDASAAPDLEADSLAEHFLLHVAQHPGCRNRDLSDALGSSRPVDDGQLSRLGSRLLSLGLVQRLRAGRNNVWELTPRGERAVRAIAERAITEFMANAENDGDDTVMIASPTAFSHTLQQEIQHRGTPERLVIFTEGGTLTYRRTVGGDQLGNPTDAGVITLEQVASLAPADAPEQVCVSDRICYERLLT